MSVARVSHAQVALPGGRVLVVGNASGAGELRSPEPIAGGAGPSEGPARNDSGDRTAEIYDVATGQFTLSTTLTLDRCAGCAAVALGQGRILVAGGWDRRGPVLDSAEYFDPGANRFVPLEARMTVPRIGAEMTGLPDGRILVTGGHDGQSPHDRTELFDPQTDRFTAVEPLSAPRLGRAVVVKGGQVLLVAGQTSNNRHLDTVEAFDAASGSWYLVGRLLAPRHGHEVTLLADGNVLVTGGLIQAGDRSSDTAEIFELATGRSVATVERMKVPRVGHRTHRLADGRVLIFGGTTPRDLQTDVVEIFDPATRTFRVGEATMTTARASAGVTLLESGDLLVAGGHGPDGAPLASAELFRPCR